MADDIDIANEMVANELSRALNKLRQHTNAGASVAKFCVECGETIPKARQELGLNLCLPCAQESERKKSLFIDY